MSMGTSDNHEVAQRLRRIEDRFELGELISRYGVAVDDRDFDTLEAMYVEDSYFNGITGRKAIMDFYRERGATYGPTYHYAHTWHFDFESDDAATGLVTAHAELSLNGKTLWLGMRYMDRYQRAGGKWRFKARENKFRYVLPFEEMATAYGDRLRKRWPGTENQPVDLPDQVATFIAHKAAQKR